MWIRPKLKETFATLESHPELRVRIQRGHSRSPTTVVALQKYIEQNLSTSSCLSLYVSHKTATAKKIYKRLPGKIATQEQLE